MDQALYPVIAGALTLTIGAISFWGRFALSRFGAKAASSVNRNISYEKAYQRRVRYGYNSGLILLAIGGILSIYGIAMLAGQ